MESYRQGLNYVPMLTQNNTPPCSGRSRISLKRRRFQNSILHYNGNYEGDSSMFGDKEFELERLSLVDTESDTELPSGTTIHSSARLRERYRKTSLVWRLGQVFMTKFLRPELREKISMHVENFQESSLVNKLAKWSGIALTLFNYCFHFIKILGKHLAVVGTFLWRQRVIFRNLARSLLWRLTLAKCNDLTLFVLILLGAPVLFILSLIGFFISLCGCLKDTLQRCRHILNKVC